MPFTPVHRSARRAALALVAGPLLAVPALAAVPTAPALAAPAQAAPVATSTAERAPTPTCQGLRATRVGAPDRPLLRGTPGRDVIVTNGSTTVRAAAGADLICVTRVGRTAPRIAAGPGDDAVRVAAGTTRAVVVELGPGRDRYVGAAGPDRVAGNNLGGRDGGVGNDLEPDVIATGPGNDVVVSGGERGMTDRIDLGPGNDQLDMRARVMTGGGRLRAGTGGDALTVAPRTTTGSFVHDARDGVGRRNGLPWLRVAGVETYSLGLGPDTSLEFTGSAAPETVLDVEGRLTVDLRGGADGVVVRQSAISPASRLLGGGGSDRIAVIGGTDLVVDTASGTASAGAGAPVTELAGFESAYAQAETVSLLGSPRPDVLAAGGCNVTVAGGDEDDVLSYLLAQGYAELLDCARIRTDLRGGEGDDALVGGRGRDTLVGDGGTDTADGAGNVDVCSAERVTACETTG